MKPSYESIAATLLELAHRYPSELVDHQVLDVPRISFNIDTALRAVASRPLEQLEVCDLGGGLGLFSLGCAASGVKRSVLVDDFEDQLVGDAKAALALHETYGVEILNRDIIAAGIEDIEGMFDVITTFDSMEHWHHSPKELFRQVVGKLKPRGAFVLSAPNCVNLRKRMSGLLGRGKWSAMKDWYEPTKFRGHVREPDVEDIKYIARDMGLTDVRIFGRNWLGYSSRTMFVRKATILFDRLLQGTPALCSDLYLVGHKPSV